MPSKYWFRFDEIGYWSEIKLDIVKQYAAAYSTILSAQRAPAFHHSYIDAFSGAGVHISKRSKEYIPGSPQNALLVTPPFKDYYFIDLDGLKLNFLADTVGDRQNMHIYSGDCNEILLKEVLPRISYEKRQRALCLLDPYGLHVKWSTIMAIAQTRAIEIFYNFSIYDANLNVLLTNPTSVDPDQERRMTECWGDESWRDDA